MRDQRPALELTYTQHELLELVAAHPLGYVTKSAEGSKDMMALAMGGLVHDVYEMPSGGYSGHITTAGLNLLFRNEVNR